MIKQSKDWGEFLKKMADLGYEIKYGKHIAFKPKDKARFTRAKTIGEDYTEERLKERIAERALIKTPAIKKCIGNIIDMKTNAKVKESKGYKYWATKNNPNTMAESIIYIREHGINPFSSLMNAFKKLLMQDNIFKIKSKRLIRKYSSYPLPWSKTIQSKNIEDTTKNIALVLLTRHFLKSTKLGLPSTRMLFSSLKSPIPSCQIQRIFWIGLMN